VGARPITFLSDYGYADEFAGVCRALIARIAPDARVIDLTHGVPRHDVRRGAVSLLDALPHAPAGVHLAVVDPGVGTDRRGVAVAASDEGRVFVGPDNGLLLPAIEAFGGAVESVDLARSPFRLDPVSATFHGRDVFAPVAARLALGAALAEAGDPIEPGSLVRLELPSARAEGDRVVAEVLHVDGFGNATLGMEVAELPDGWFAPGASLAVEAGGRSHRVIAARTFGDVGEGELLAYENSSARVTLAANGASAAAALGLAPGDRVVLEAVR
jgi:S-adenosyl-L-methionine hydrolase (adenosine-forming)